MYIGELLEIIKKVSTYCDEDGELIDNYRTWWYFIKILVKLPSNKITQEIIDLVPIWLNSRYGGSLVDADATLELLPKFLHSDASAEDIFKAQTLIDYLTDLKFVQKRGLLSDEENQAIGLVENHWLKDFFIDHSGTKLLGELCDESVFYKLADKIKKVITKTNHSRINIDYKKVTYRLILNLETDFEFLCTIGTYTKNSLNGEEDLKNEKSVNFKKIVEFKFFAQNSEIFTEELNLKLANLSIPKDVISKIQQELPRLYESVYQDFSYIWFKHLTHLPAADNLYEYKHMILYILVQSLYELELSNSARARQIILTFLTSRYQHEIFKRIVLAFIARNWSKHKDIFLNKLLEENSGAIFDDPAFETELRELLKENASKFTSEEKNKIDEYISKGPQNFPPGDNKNQYILYWKQRWYRLLKDDVFFTSKYDAVKSLSSYDVEKDPQEISASWVSTGPSPILEEDILRISNVELAEKIKNFIEADFFAKGPSTEGFAKAIEKAIKTNPEKFSENLVPFVDVGFFYFSHILDGFRAAWDNKTWFEWRKVIDFVHTYINRSVFWENKLKTKAGFYDSNYVWVLGSLGELIQTGTKDDEWAISKENFPKLKQIFDLVANNSAAEDREVKNFASHVLNCGWGKICTGLVYFTLLLARENKKVESAHWDDDLKKIFEIFLKRDIADAYAVLGENLISFSFLDNSWVLELIKKIFNTKKAFLWDAFMNGYLMSGRVSLDIYIVMTSNYLRALSSNFDETILKDRLIDHIAIAYLNNVEDLNGNGLLNSIWENWNATQITSLIRYFSSVDLNHSENEQDELFIVQVKDKVLQFWREIYSKLKNKKFLSKDDKEILSDITNLSEFIIEIDDENYKWLMLSAPYIEENFHSTLFLESLNRLKNTGEKVETAKRIGNIYLSMMKSFTPDYDPKDIKEIIEFLYFTNDSEIKKIADQICINYAKSEIEIVTEIYQKYN